MHSCLFCMYSLSLTTRHVYFWQLSILHVFTKYSLNCFNIDDLKFRSILKQLCKRNNSVPCYIVQFFVILFSSLLYCSEVFFLMLACFMTGIGYWFGYLLKMLNFDYRCVTWLNMYIIRCFLQPKVLLETLVAARALNNTLNSHKISGMSNGEW